MAALLLSLLALGVAPLVDRPLGRSPRLSSGLDAATMVVIAGVVFLQVLPHGVVDVGWPAVVAALLGLATPLGCDRLSFGEGLIRLLAAVALSVHGLLDGAALATGGHEGEALSMAVVLHSLPMGLAVWRAVAEHGGRRLAGGMLLLSAVAETVGWFWAPSLAGSTGEALILAQCFVAGSLLHLVSHGRPVQGWPSGVGALVGAGFTILVLAEHPLPSTSGAELAMGEAFLGLAAEAAPALLGALAVHVALMARGGLRPSLRQALLSPSSPLSLAALLPTVALLGAPFALARGLAGLFTPRDLPAEEAEASAALASPLLWVALGLGVAALGETLLPVDAFAGVPASLGVIGAALLGAPLWLSAAGLTPVAALLVHKGLSLGAALALLVVGPFGGRRAGEPWGVTLRRLGRAVALGLGVGLLADALPIELIGPSLHAMADHVHDPIEWGALAMTSALLIALLLREGLSGMLERLRGPPAHKPLGRGADGAETE